jgi:hypothetical protein
MVLSSGFFGAHDAPLERQKVGMWNRGPASRWYIAATAWCA